MKIITRKQQDELLKRLTANLIIASGEHMNIESFDKFLENTLECAYAIGSFDGMVKVHKTFSKYLRGGRINGK